MAFWSDHEEYSPEKLDDAAERLLAALSGKDEAQAVKILEETSISERGTPICLRRALDHSPELFRKVLERCPPGEYSEICVWARGGLLAEVRGRGSLLLLLAAVLDRPHHARLLLEHGYDCNGGGVGFDWSRQRMRAAYGDTVPPYARWCGACGNRLEVQDWERRRSWSIACATPLASALLRGSLETAEVLLAWPGVWKEESSAVCRAAVMVLEGVACSLLSEERQAARLEILRRIFCPEREYLPDREDFLRAYALQPASFVDFCRVQTLRCQLENGLCGEKDARRMLEILGAVRWTEGADFDSTRSGKLLLMKKYFPQVCSQPWATGGFLRELLWRSKYERPRRLLLEAWKQLCGGERDLTWAGWPFWELDRQALRRFLRETGEGGTLVLDSDAVPSGCAPACLAELLNRVRFRRRGGDGVSGLMQVLLGAGDLRLLARAAKRGILSGEDPVALMEYLIKTPGISKQVRAAVLAYAERKPPAEDGEDWRDPRRWEYWEGWFPVGEAECREDLDAVLRRELSPKECLWWMFRLQQYRKQERTSSEFSLRDVRYPTLRTDSLCGIACCAENGRAMEFLMKYLPHKLLESVSVTWDWLFFFKGTPLTLAAALGRTEQVRLLLESGVHPDEPGRGDASRFFVVRYFMEDGVSVTPLLAAILFGQEETARLLLDAGAVCDVSAHLHVLRQGSAATLDLAARLPGVSFEKIPEQEMEALRIGSVSGTAIRRTAGGSCF